MLTSLYTVLFLFLLLTAAAVKSQPLIYSNGLSTHMSNSAASLPVMAVTTPDSTPIMSYTPPAPVISSYTGPTPIMHFPFAAAPVAHQLVPAVTDMKYHSQDELGRASFGYSYPGQSANNYRDAFGNQIGHYAYINPEGKHVQYSYVADSNGFRVLSNDLSVAPVDINMPVGETEEVAEARAAHLAAVENAKNSVLPLDMPQPVEDTEEVAAAKPQHALAIAAANAAIDAARQRKTSTYYLYPSVDQNGHHLPLISSAPYMFNYGATAPFLPNAVSTPQPMMPYTPSNTPIMSFATLNAPTLPFPNPNAQMMQFTTPNAPIMPLNASPAPFISSYTPSNAPVMSYTTPNGPLMPFTTSDAPTMSYTTPNAAPIMPYNASPVPYTSSYPLSSPIISYTVPTGPFMTVAPSVDASTSSDISSDDAAQVQEDAALSDEERKKRQVARLGDIAPFGI